MIPKVTTITVRRLVSGPDYSNRAIEATADVGSSDPQAVREQLESWLGDQLATPNVVRGFTPHEAEMLADDIRYMRAAIARRSRTLAKLLGAHECMPRNAPQDFGGRQCRLCAVPMPSEVAADPTERHDEADVPF